MILRPDDFQPTKLVSLKAFLEKRIVGQERAIKQIVRAMNVSAAELNEPQRPLAVLFFAGPTGVGKTETALALADYFYQRWLFKQKFLLDKGNVSKGLAVVGTVDMKAPSDSDNRCLVRIDCGNFGGTMGHGVINLIGAPPSYVGYNNEPILIPSAFLPDRLTVLLFDEIEKAFFSEYGGQNFIGILMRIFDEGRLMNNRNQQVDFSKSVIICTSNLGSKDILTALSESKIGFRQSMPVKLLSDTEIETLNSKIYKVVKQKFEELFPPEFRARIDRLLVFHFLTKNNLEEILERQISVFNILLFPQKIRLIFSSRIKDWILSNINREFGVRDMKKIIRNKVKDGLARILNTPNNPIDQKREKENLVSLLVDLGENEQIIFVLD